MLDLLFAPSSPPAITRVLGCPQTVSLALGLQHPFGIAVLRLFISDPPRDALLTRHSQTRGEEAGEAPPVSQPRPGKSLWSLSPANASSLSALSKIDLVSSICMRNLVRAAACASPFPTSACSSLRAVRAVGRCPPSQSHPYQMQRVRLRK